MRLIIVLLSLCFFAFHAQAQTTRYRVFFDWDRATLTNQAHQTIQQAASAARASNARITVNGFTDTSGSVPYNQGLSLRRAQIVAAELERYGVPEAAISIQAYGGRYLLTPTAVNVREAHNRGVDIIVQTPAPTIVAVPAPPPPPPPYLVRPPAFGYWGWGGGLGAPPPGPPAIGFGPGAGPPPGGFGGPPGGFGGGPGAGRFGGGPPGTFGGGPPGGFGGGPRGGGPGGGPRGPI